MTEQTASDKHFARVFYDRGYKDASTGSRFYCPPAYNANDRWAYDRGFRAAQEDYTKYMKCVEAQKERK